jgi:hypothetical protein
MAMSAAPAQADEMSDLKALIKELKSQVQEQNSQVKALKSQVNDLNAQINTQKQQVTAQGAQVQSQSQAIQKVEAQQQVIEQKQAAAPAAVPAAAAAPEGYWAIPGTKTGIKIGGYLKADITDDISSRAGNSVNWDPTAIPLKNSAQSKRNGQMNFSAQETRFNIKTLTKTESFGDIASVIEGDFEKVQGSTIYGSTFRLRHAYVSGAGFTVGQTWSTFADLDTTPETLDFNGPVGWAGARNIQLRYTAKLPTGAVDLAVESPQANLGVSNSADNHIDKAPDLVIRYSVDTSWGHIGVAGLGRYLSSDSGLPNQNANKFVYGVLAGVGIKTIGKDLLTFQTVDGNGVGSYEEQGPGVTAVLVNNNTLKPINIRGGTLAYQHFWSDKLRSTAAVGYEHLSTPVSQTIKEMRSLHVNLIWSPLDSTDVGVEYIYGRLGLSAPVTDVNGTSASYGTAIRIQGSVKYSF